ncbi:MAG: DUF4080 domain-containing protein [Deltaproteobacteria bacterium]|nr:DUF4080 domain-containing protein [Deltaproteobacteria bacterium]
MRVLLATLHSKFIHPSLALPYLATFCGEVTNCEILLREFTVHEPKDQIFAAILEQKPDLLAFSVYIWNRRAVLELVDAVAVAVPELPIILGGPEVSFDGEELLERHPGIRGLVRGEGEAPFREILKRLTAGASPAGTPRTLWRTASGPAEGAWSPPLSRLDDIPSPFAAGWVDLNRGFVYLETSRGCPYRCSFCMSSLDPMVRSFSMERIRSDLLFLMEREVPKIKLVDRTFNYDPDRAREIFSFILENNRGSHFHFEIGAERLDDATLQLLSQVPEGMFQFEIGIQSLSPATLAAIRRRVSPEKTWDQLRKLRRDTRITLHLDLIAGLPGEGMRPFLAAIDQVLAFEPHHLQIEPVKLLPGSPLRGEAADRGLRFDPNPPYTVLATPDLSCAELELLRKVGRLVDLIYNSGVFPRAWKGLSRSCGSAAEALQALCEFWKDRDLFRFPLQQRDIFRRLGEFIGDRFPAGEAAPLMELLALDCARSERPAESRPPLPFDTSLTPEEKAAVQDRVGQELARIKGQGIKMQHFAAAFSQRPEFRPRTVVLFLYFTRTGAKMTVAEIPLPCPGESRRGE